MIMNNSPEATINFVSSDLKDCLSDFMNCYNSRQKGDNSAVFYDDKEKDIEEIQKHIDALDLIIRFYDEVPS